MPNEKNRKGKIDQIADQARFMDLKRTDDEKTNKKALAEYFSIHGHAVYQFAFELCRDMQDAEDAVARAFSVLWEKRHGLKDLKQLENCLYQAARKEAMAILKRKARILILKKELADLSGQSPDRFEIQKSLIKAGAYLVEQDLAKYKSSKSRLHAFLRQYLKMLSDDEFTGLMGLSSETVYAFYQGSVRRLRLAIRDDRFEAIAACLILLLTTHSWLNFFY